MDACRKGPWKALRLPEPFGNGDWQLYDLSTDPGETNDLASEFPKRLDELTRAWEDYAKTNGVIRPDSAKSYDRPIVGRKY